MNKPTVSKPQARSGRKAELSVNSKKPTFTRLSSSGTTRKNSVASKPNKTHSGMLHQSRTLKDATADKPQDRHETGSIREPHGSLLYDNIVEMSETPSGDSVTAPLTRSETGPVTDPGTGLTAGSRHFQTHKNNPRVASPRP